MFVALVCVFLSCYLHLTGIFTLKSPYLQFALFAGSIVSSQSLREYVWPRNKYLGQTLLYGYGFVQGSSIASAVSQWYLLYPWTLLNALLSTLALFGACFITALMTPRLEVNLTGLMVMLVLYFGLIAKLGILYNWSIPDKLLQQLFLFVSCSMVFSSTQLMIGKVERNPSRADPIQDAMGVLENVINMLTRFLCIAALETRDNSGKK